MRSARPAEAGFSLVELVVTLALGSLILSAATSLLRSGLRLAASHAARIETEETLRISAHILASELRLLDPAVDLELFAARSLGLRAFRGAGLACPSDGDRLLVRYRGLRQPEPAKDSVLVLNEAGQADVRALDASVRVTDGCPRADGELLFQWDLGDQHPDASLLLLFEHGSYHLSEHALRYVRGAGGQQPLTAESLDVNASQITYRAPTSGQPPDAGESAVLEIDLATLPPRGHRTRGDHPAAVTERLRIPLPNAGPSASAGGDPW